MWISTLEIEDDFFTFPPHRTTDLIGSHSHAIVIDIVFEILFVFGHDHIQDRAHGPLVTIEHFHHGSDQLFNPEAVCHLKNPALSQSQCSHNGIEIRTVPFRQTAVSKNKFEYFGIQLTVTNYLDRRNLYTFLKHLCRICRQTARHLPSDVGHMPEHRCPGHQSSVDIDRHHHQPVIEVADCSIACVGIVGQENVPLLYSAVISLLKPPEKRAELTNYHFALMICNHGERIMLFSYSG